MGRAVGIWIRRLSAEWRFHGLVVTSLTLGIGASTAVFTLVDAALLRPLQFERPEELVLLRATLRGPTGEPQFYLVSPANFVEMRSGGGTLEAVEAVRARGADLIGEGEPLRVQAAEVTPGLFTTLGARAILGRTLAPGDAGGVAVLSQGLWSRAFGADPGILGRGIVLDGASAAVVGIVPDRLAFPAGTELWIPWRPEEVPERDRHGGGLAVIGRLRPGVELEDARRDMTEVAARLTELYPENNTGRGIAVHDLREPFVTDARGILLALLGSVVLFLAVACANVASLQLVRARRRTGGVALRCALGAPPRRVLAEIAAEAGAVGALSVLLALAASAVTVPFLSEALAITLAGGAPDSLGGRVVAFAAMAGILTTLAFATGPVLLALRASPATLMRSGGRGGGAGRTERRVQGLAVAGQAALGTLLLLTAGASVDRVLSLVRVDPGFTADDAFTLRIPASPDRYPSAADRTAFYEEVRYALAATPGVEAVGASDILPVGDPNVNWSFSVEDRPPPDPNDFEVARGRLVLPGYFEAVGIPLVRGRGIEERDRMGEEPVVVVSQTLAARYWPGQDPIGRRIKRRSWNSAFPWMTVVGVVGDVRDGGLDAEIGATLYLPSAQHDTRFGFEMSYVVRSSLGASELALATREAVHRVDGRAPIIRTASMNELLRSSNATEDVAGKLLSSFAAGSILLLALGVYGVLARAVQERTREVGVRVALGAGPQRIVLMLIRSGLTLLAAGTLVGVLVSPAAVGLAARLAGASLEAPAWVYLATVACTLTAGVAASIAPSIRAIRVDPVDALRGE